MFYFLCLFFFNFYVRLGGGELETGCGAAAAVPAHVCTPSDMVFTWTLVDLGHGPYPAGLELHSQTWQGTSGLSWRLPPGCCAGCLVSMAKPPPSYPTPGRFLWAHGGAILCQHACGNPKGTSDEPSLCQVPLLLHCSSLLGSDAHAVSWQTN